MQSSITTLRYKYQNFENKEQIKLINKLKMMLLQILSIYLFYQKLWLYFLQYWHSNYKKNSKKRLLESIEKMRKKSHQKIYLIILEPDMDLQCQIVLNSLLFQFYKKWGRLIYEPKQSFFYKKWFSFLLIIIIFL